MALAGGGKWRLLSGVLVLLVLVQLLGSSLLANRASSDGNRLLTRDDKGRSPSSSQGSPKRRCLLLSWTKWFFNENLPEVLRRMPPCEFLCEFTYDRARLHEADAVFFHARDISVQSLPEKRQGQPWILFTQEPWTYELNILYMRDGKAVLTEFSDLVRRNRHALQNFDYLGTPALSSDFPFPYHGPLISEPPNLHKRDHDLWNELTLEKLTRPYGRDFAPPSARGGIAGFVSNCANDFSGRIAYLRELLRSGAYADIRGKCFTTKHDMADKPIGDVLQMYNFVLSFENSNCVEYVTEKLFRNGLQYGAVPIVDGPDSYREYVPNDLAVLHTLDFAHPQTLGRYIALLRAEQTLFYIHAAHRVNPMLVKHTFVKQFIADEGKMKTEPYFMCPIYRSIHTGVWPRRPRRNALRHFFDSFADYSSSPCGFNGHWAERLAWQNAQADKTPVFVVPRNRNSTAGAHTREEDFFLRDLLSTRGKAPFDQLFVWNRLFHTGKCVRLWHAAPIRNATAPPVVIKTEMGSVKHSISPEGVFQYLAQFLNNPRREAMVHFSEENGYAIWEKRWAGDFQLASFNDSAIILEQFDSGEEKLVPLEDLRRRVAVLEHCPLAQCGLRRPPIDSVAPPHTMEELGCAD